MQNQINIRPLLNDLLTLTENTRQEEISKLRKVSMIFVNNHDEVRRALRNRIKEWNDVLDDYYERSKDSVDIIKHLREIAKALITGQKTNAIRAILQREGYGNDASLEKNLKRTETLISRIINTHFFEVQNLEIKSPHAALGRELMGLIPESQPITVGFSGMFRATSPFDVATELLMSRVDGMSPEKDDAWLRKLAHTLESIEDPKQFGSVIAKLSFHQIFVLILDFAKANKATMALNILKAAKDDVVLECLRSFSPQELDQIDKALKTVKDINLLQTTFAYIREIFVTKANAFTPQINDVAKTLRTITVRDRISQIHLGLIVDFQKPIEELMATNANFHRLVTSRTHLLDSITVHMPDKIKLTCEDRLSRVTNTPQARAERDNLYSILVELAYGDVESYGDLYLCFAELGLTEIKHFVSLGMNVPPLPVNTDNSQLRETLVKEQFCGVYDQFKKLGIETFDDLIKKNIYNYEQLKKLVNNGKGSVSLPSAALKS